MPSVRVKRNDSYAQLRDDGSSSSPASQSRPFRLGSVSGAVASSSPRTPLLEPTSPPPLDHNASLTPSESLGRRDGRVHSFIRRRSSAARPSLLTASPQHSQGSGQRRRASTSRLPPQRTADGDVIFEGTSADVAVPNMGNELKRVGSALSLDHGDEGNELDDEHHNDDVVEHLEVVDPSVATVSTLANTANAILIPPLDFYSRKPVMVLPRLDRDVERGTDSRDELDRHVEDVLRKRDKFRRIMQGVWSFLKTPMGICVGIYGVLVVFWGAGIVFFLAKMINLHNYDLQQFWIEICSQILCGLFTITGIGLIPWRTIDTYRMYKIWHYKRKIRKLRRQAGLPDLYDDDDLPDPIYDENYVHVLTEKEQADLHYQQQQFMKSQTWYRPHGTETHRAFPINTAMTICLLNDWNSIFQIMLSACQWSMDRIARPDWTTGLLIPASFMCGIGSGVYIWRGGKKTRRTEHVEKCLRDALQMHAVSHGKEGTEGTHSANGTPESMEMLSGKGRVLRKQTAGTPEIMIEEEMTVPPNRPSPSEVNKNQ
ncbi:hypothetical protein EWM64_g71 [Hericium alpestre]|uniref:Uncharacterized protein n=1 Tax=Hericium alpestre TaxID=135208 RepID=A0A4Z0AA15_9AGAM|nr:hypothetical protein EWM64_g71 [Hericium alpestre]